ncbi:hypothetical protein E4T56_gene13764 [Termitomyces sp. T112]|nr:hypothetical protein E4T56_gene13764 [Termitomyces sp. T112]
MALANGVYIVRNTTKAYGVNKVLDISTGDGTTILGYNEHDGPNQQWYIFKEDTSTQGDLYSIRDGYYGRFLSYSLASSTVIGMTACMAPLRWHIVQLGNGLARIAVAGAPTLVFELGSTGLVYINPVSEGNAAQVWKFQSLPCSRM